MNKHEIQQKEKIKAFDKELFSYTGQVAWFVPALISFFQLIFMIVPYQEWAEEHDFLWFSIYLPMLISYLVLLPYVNTTDALSPQQKKNKTYDKLKYLPISKKQYILARMEYLFRYFSRLTIIGLILQCIFSLLIAKDLGIANILYAIITLFVIPMTFGQLQLLTT